MYPLLTTPSSLCSLSPPPASFPFSLRLCLSHCFLATPRISLAIAPPAAGAPGVLSLIGISAYSARCLYLVSFSDPPPIDLRGCGERAVSSVAMTQWVGDTWRLKAGPQPDPASNSKMPDGPTAEADPELRRQGYKESFVQEYDGIKVYHHQGRYQHLGPQIYSWAFYEYRMVINSECWNMQHLFENQR